MTVRPYDGTLAGKRALVTGSTRGLGRTIAEWLAHAGADIYVSGRDDDDVERTVGELRELGVSALGSAADLSTPDAARHLAHEAIAQFGHIDILVNNAGFSIPEDFWDVSDHNWDAQVAVNVRSPFVLSQVIGKHMIDASICGRIVNISTIGVFAAHTNTMVYDIAKGGVQAMTRAMAYELGQHGITANCIAPGAVPDRPGSHDEIAPATEEFWKTHMPMGRLGSSDDIANAALFFCQPTSGWITGQTLLVDGGHISYLWGE